MSEPTNTEKKDVILTFFKEAFCVDGDVQFVKKEIRQDYCIKLTDSRRGTFYIASESERRD